MTDESKIYKIILPFDDMRDVLDITLTNEAIEDGSVSRTDRLHPDIQLYQFSMKIDNQILWFQTENLPQFKFVLKNSSEFMRLSLNANYSSILIDKNTLTAVGEPLSGTLNQIVKEDLKLNCHVMMSGSIRIDNGHSTVHGYSFYVKDITDKNGDIINRNDNRIYDLINMILNGRFNHYSLKFRRVNTITSIKNEDSILHV